jgi:hypothetical protein
MKINFLTLSDLRGASSRIRCFFLGEQLRDLGYEVEYNQRNADEDVLIIQKNINDDIIRYARHIHYQGKSIIYDIDDFGIGIEYLNIKNQTWKALREVCSIITFDTAERQEQIMSCPHLSQIPFKVVVPDSIDYEPWLVMSRKKRMPGIKSNGAWFGNAINFQAAVPYIDHILQECNISKFEAITGRNALNTLAHQYPKIGYRIWDLESFVSTLREYDFTLLIHNNDLEGQMKSNNKMLAALAIGVIPFVSHTEAYTQTAMAIGMPELIISDLNDLNHFTFSSEALAPLYEKLNSNRCQEYLKKYTSKEIANQYVIDVLKRVTHDCTI